MDYPELPDSVLALEEEILRRWDEEETFRRSVEEREGAPEFVFYEGPPTANGRPGVHHVLARTLKDLVARYRTMTGHHVTRIAGWDTHGLPVEIEAEEELGISGKPEIEELGIAEFNEVCRDNIFTYKDEWEKLSRRIGYWLDYDRAYITCSEDFVESVWWALAEIDRKGLLYKGHRVLPYCPRCGTGLSSHEVAQGYREVVDTAVFVAFPLTDDPDDAAVLSWTTTPWTLPGNVALAVDPEIEYVRVRVTGGGDDEDGSPTGARPGDVLVLARDRMEEVLADEVEVLDAFPGSELVGRRYLPPFEGAVDGDDHRDAWTVLSADFVTTDEGTGVVHTAVMYGEDDYRLGQERDLPREHTVGPEGRFLDEVGEPLAGRRVDAPDTERLLLEHLRGEERLYRSERYPHSYPHCWRCDAALLYMAMDSWYVETTAVKDRLLENNASVDWHPPEIGEGRMGEWLENNVDWALSRDRYWGTPLPIWECDADEEHREVLGSYEELAERAGPLGEDFDPHRPEIDDHAWPCPEEGCVGTMRRVEQVADAWFDSGSMPYAQWHYPFENEEAFETHFPADFIAEGVDQTRGWFYSLLALSTLLFDEPAYRSVVVNDLVLDAEGRKMSKSRGNTVDPWAALERHGADAIRFFLVSSSNPWLPKRWDPDGLAEVARKLFDTLRNSYRFFAMYANLEGWEGPEDAGLGRLSAGTAAGGGDVGPVEPRPVAERSALDRWLLSRLDTLTARMREELDGYDLTAAARRLSDFTVDELSNWYVRRSRDRFWATPGSGLDRRDTADAFATLDEALRTVARALAPFSPFLSDWLHRALAGGTSAHLADFPVPAGRADRALEREMEDARRLAALGRAAREEAGLKVRQPLREVRVVVPGGRRLSPEVSAILREELNVRRVEFLDADDEIVRLHVKPDYSALGPRFGEATPAVAEAVEGLDDAAARRLRSGESVVVSHEGAEAEVGPDEVEIVEEARGELAVGTGRGYTAALDPELDADLRREGLARELVSRVQRLRRDAGLEVADRIRLAVAGDEALEEAVRAHRREIAGETLALEDGEPRLAVGEAADGAPEHTEEVEIEGHRGRIGLSRASRG